MVAHQTLVGHVSYLVLTLVGACHNLVTHETLVGAFASIGDLMCL